MQRPSAGSPFGKILISRRPRPLSDIASIANDLYTKENIYVLDGGVNCNAPIWSFLSPTREADIIFVADAGGFTSVDEPTLSSDSATAPGTCPIDATNTKTCTDGDTWSGTKCCKECEGGAALLGVFGCFSSNGVSKSNVFSTIARYQARMPSNSAPPVPDPDGPEFPSAKFGERVVIFGCHTGTCCCTTE